jgi:hypothetical protein
MRIGFERFAWDYTPPGFERSHGSQAKLPRYAGLVMSAEVRHPSTFSFQSQGLIRITSQHRP